MPYISDTVPFPWVEWTERPHHFQNNPYAFRNAINWKIDITVENGWFMVRARDSLYFFPDADQIEEIEEFEYKWENSVWGVYIMTSKNWKDYTYYVLWRIPFDGNPVRIAPIWMHFELEIVDITEKEIRDRCITFLMSHPSKSEVVRTPVYTWVWFIKNKLLGITTDPKYVEETHYPFDVPVKIKDANDFLVTE